MFIGCLFFLPSLTYLVLRLKPLLSCHCFLYFPFPLFWDTDVFKPMLCKPVFCNEIRQAIASNRFLIQHMFVFWLGDIFTDIGSRCVFGWSVFFMSLRMKICTYHVSLFHAEHHFSGDVWPGDAWSSFHLRKYSVCSVHFAFSLDGKQIRKQGVCQPWPWTVVSGGKGLGWISFQAEPDGREQTRLEFLLQSAAHGFCFFLERILIFF